MERLAPLHIVIEIPPSPRVDENTENSLREKDNKVENTVRCFFENDLFFIYPSDGCIIL